MSKILEFRDPYHSVSFTGGEPLLQAAFLRDLLKEYKRFYEKTVYLETNGILYKELSKVIEYVDIVSMDFKLPTSTGCGTFWGEHGKFLKLAKKKEVFVKAVITKSTEKDDVLRMLEIIKHAGNIPVVLQPVTPVGDVKEPDAATLEDFKHALQEAVSRVEIIPQVHRLIGVK